MPTGDEKVGSLLSSMSPYGRPYKLAKNRAVGVNRKNPADRSGSPPPFSNEPRRSLLAYALTFEGPNIDLPNSTLRGRPALLRAYGVALLIKHGAEKVGSPTQIPVTFEGPSRDLRRSEREERETFRRMLPASNLPPLAGLGVVGNQGS